ncbi:MAG TPA: bifunctional riboflavin kinase/FAD synthetase [Rhodocyclaceae bacterium]|nr:bifunctional riboflavin kinase/FAD synthetase [Rhodocyclaceae bacterium]
MRVFLGVPQQAATPTVLTIGNFDGVHLGHQTMLRQLRAKADALGLPAAVLTFEPHPRELFAPDQAPARLTSLREKLALLEACGVDQTYLFRFDRKHAAMSAEEFIEQVLIGGLNVKHLIVGDDFCFGKGRRGNFAMLQEFGARHGFTVEALHTVEAGGLRASSSAVREALAKGDLEHAAVLLGRPYAIAGRVVHGDKIGRTIGFPTANVQLKRKRVPMKGVYAVTVSGLDKRQLAGAANIGVRPTVAGGLKPVLEVHLLDFSQDVYGAHLSVHFRHRLRDELKFDSFDALKRQIALDVQATQDYFSGEQHG